MNVIVWPQENDVLAVCIPTGEIPIEKVLIKDAPPHARIVSTDDFPIAMGAAGFNAVRLSEKGEWSVDQAAYAALTSLPTPEQKLAASGLTIDELKSLLGLK